MVRIKNNSTTCSGANFRYKAVSGRCDQEANAASDFRTLRVMATNLQGESAGLPRLRLVSVCASMDATGNDGTSRKSRSMTLSMIVVPVKPAVVAVIT